MPDPNKRYLIDTPDGPMTRGEAAAHYNIPKNTIIRRIWLGWPMDKVFLPPNTAMKRKHDPSKYRNLKWEGKGGFITAYGRLTLRRIAEIVGITENAMHSRLHTYQWTEDEAFNTPMFGRAGKHFVLPPEEYARRKREAILADAREREEAARKTRAERNNRKRKPTHAKSGRPGRQRGAAPASRKHDIAEAHI